MNSSSSAFFSTANDKSSETDTPLDKIKKIIDAQLAFNRLLANQVLKASAKEFMQVSSSFILKLSDIPDVEVDEKSELIKKMRRQLVNNILEDIRIYEAIKLTAINYTDTDYLYLHLHCALTEAERGKEFTRDQLKALLSLLFRGRQLDAMTKKVQRSLASQTLDSPLVIELKMFKEMLKLLEPGDSCIAFKECFEIKCENGLSALTDYYRTEKTHNNIIKWVSPYLEKLSKEDDQELYNLYQQYIFAYNNMQPPGFVGNEFHLTFLVMFDNFKPLFKARNDLKDKLHKLAINNKKEPILQTPTVVQIKKKEISATPVIKQANKKILQEPVVILPPDVPQESASSHVMEKTPPLLVVIEDIPVVISSKDEVIPEMKIEVDMEARAEVAIESVADIAIEEEYTIDYSEYTLFKKPEKLSKESQALLKKEQSPLIQTTQFEQYNNDHHEILLKVFDTTQKHEIGLRGLVSLAKALGGTITVTGANRCRIEIKSIYSYLLMSEEALQDLPSNQCKKATVTFHGGGHRQKPSQNHDRGIAPSYLVEQFRDAFKRAGFIPETVLHNVAVEKNNTNSK